MPVKNYQQGRAQAPAIVISEILIVGATVDDRQLRSLPIISTLAIMSFRLPAIVISCTG
jgi:hypothetical protein